MIIICKLLINREDLQIENYYCYYFDYYYLPDLDNIYMNGIHRKFSTNGNHEKISLTCENCFCYV